MLLVDGTLDAQTPDYRLDGARAHFTGAGQELVLVPNAVHASLLHSDCTFAMVTSFVKDPLHVDTTCAASPAPLGFRGTADAATRAFGAADLWEN